MFCYTVIDDITNAHVHYLFLMSYSYFGSYCFFNRNEKKNDLKCFFFFFFKCLAGPPWLNLRFSLTRTICES